MFANTTAAPYPTDADESRTLFTPGQPVRLKLERDLLGWLR